jgi:hypothetical protein
LGTGFEGDRDVIEIGRDWQVRIRFADGVLDE